MIVQKKLEKFDAILDDVEGTPMEAKVMSYKYILETLHVLDLWEIDGEDQGKDKFLRMRARNVFQDMMSFSMGEIIQLAEDISAQIKSFSKEEIIQDYLEAKNRIWLEMIVLLENEYNHTVDELIKNSDRYAYVLELQKKQKDHELIEYVIDSIKEAYYQEEIAKFFPTKNPKQAVKSFIDKCVEYGSFFVALELVSNKPNNKTLKETAGTREDKIRLLLLTRRILMYYPQGGVKEWGNIIEYQFQDVCMHVAYGSDRQELLASLGQTVNDFFHLSVSPSRESQWDWILELCVVCLRGMKYDPRGSGVRHVGDMFAMVQNNISHQEKNRIQKIADDFWKVIVLKQPCLQEDGFYGSYQQRFSLEDMRIWNRIEILANEYQDWIATKKELKKIAHHKDFFRWKYNNYLCDFYIVRNKIISQREKKGTSVPDDLEKMKRIYHEWNKMIVNEYPIDQSKEKVKILDAGKKEIEHIEKNII